MSPITQSAVNVFAVLESFRDQSPDIMQSLTPFFEPLLQRYQGQVFDPSQFTNDVRSIYKWNFTEDIAEAFIPQFVSNGWLLPDDPRRLTGPYTVTLPDRPTTETESRILQAFDDIAREFRVFAEGLSPLTTLSQDTDHFKEILLEWLIYVDAFSAQNLNYQTHNITDETGHITQRLIVPKITSLGDDEIYLCARFVEHAITEETSIADTLCKVASIGLLTEVVQDFRQPATIEDRSNLIVYLDGPIALELLGVSGTAARENIEPIVSTLQSIGVQVRIFGVSLEEITRSLTAVLNETNRTGPTARALAKGSVLEAYVRSVAQNPEKELKRCNVGVTFRSRDQFPNEAQFFDKERYDHLYADLRFHQDNFAAREHDATVATFIVQMRRGYETQDLFDSRFVLLTRNGIFAQQSKRSCANRISGERYISPVVHRRLVATAVWLRTGLNWNGDEVPRRYLLASCERVLALRPGVVDAVMKFSSNLTKEQAAQLGMLLTEDRSTQMLMDKTLGASKVITGENVSQLFDEMITPYLEDERTKHSEELKEQRKESSKKIRRQEERAKEARAEATIAQEKLSSREEEDVGVVREFASGVTRSILRKKKARQAICLLLAILLALPISGVFGESGAWRYFSLAVGIVLAYMTLSGYRLVGMDVSAKKCEELLHREANRNALDRKLSRCEYRWTGRKFEIKINAGAGTELDL